VVSRVIVRVHQLSLISPTIVQHRQSRVVLHSPHTLRNNVSPCTRIRRRGHRRGHRRKQSQPSVSSTDRMPNHLACVRTSLLHSEGRIGHGRAEAERRRRARVRCETRERSARHGNDQRKRRPSHMPTKYDARAQPLATDAQRTFHRTRRGGRSWSHKMARLDVSRSQPLSRIQHPRALRRGRWTRGRGRATGKRATRAALAARRRGQRGIRRRGW